MINRDTSHTLELAPLPEVDPHLQAVLIGGGSAYSTGKNWPEDGNLLEAGLDLTGLERPTVLIVPSARWKSEVGLNRVVGGFQNYYESRGLQSDVLHPFLYPPHSGNVQAARDVEIDPSRVPSASEMREKTEAADLVFVLGGDTNRMLHTVWQPLGIDKLLIKAMERGAVMSGTSAGAIAWFEGGHTDGDSLKGDSSLPEKFHYVRALGKITGAVVCPHYDATPTDQPQRSRQESFANMMYRRRNRGELGVGIDNNTALQITAGGVVEVIRGAGDGDRTVTAMHYRSGSKQKQTLSPTHGQFRLSELVG